MSIVLKNAQCIVQNIFNKHKEPVASKQGFEKVAMGFSGDPLNHIYVFNKYTDVGVSIRCITLNVRLDIINI